MTQTKLLRTQSENRLSKQIVCYTLLFLVTAVCVYALFIVVPRTFLTNADGNVDGIAQTYPIYSEIKRKIHELLLGQGWSSWSWDIGLGDDSLMEFNTKLLNPLTYIVIAFPQKYLDIGYTLMVLISQYLSGLFFLLFATKVGLNSRQATVGAICYAFCGWSMYAIIHQGTFLMATMLLPLMLLGLEKVYRHENPLLFMAAVAMHIIYSIQWAYVGGITVLLYYFIRRHNAYRSESNPLLKDFLSFCGYGIIGIMISGIVLTGTLLKMSGATTDATVQSQVLYALSDYLNIPTGFFVMSPTHTPYSVIGVSVLCIILMPVAITRFRKSTAAIMTSVLFAASLLPITGSIFNGMSYSVGRWYYVLSFFMIWMTMEVFNEETFRNSVLTKRMLVWLGILAVWGIGVCGLLLDNISTTRILCILVETVLGCLLILFMSKWARQGDKKFEQISVAIVIIGIAGYANFSLFPGLGSNIHELCQVGRIESDFAKSTQRVGPVIQQGDTSFYRIDQVDGYTDTRIARVRANENMYWGNRSIYTYLSTMNKDWHTFSKIVGNNAGYFDRTTVYSNDNREGLDFLMGVKYFLGDSENMKPGANEYAAYGYSYDSTIDGVQVLKNRYCMGLGTVYKQYITESELMNYSPLEREQVMLQAIVVADGTAEQLKGVKHATATDIATDVRESDYSIGNYKNIDWEGSSQNGSFTVNKNGEDSSFDITIPEITDARIVVAFEGLVRESLGRDDDEKFKIELSKGNVVKAAQMRKGKNQGYSDVEDFYINLGYYGKIGGDIKVNIDRIGTYTYDSIKVYVIPMDIYKDAATTLQSDCINVESYDNDAIKGSISTDKDSILYLSVLNQDGWTAYVDGNKVATIKDGVNICFLGVAVPQGNHEIELTYKTPGLSSGIIITLIGVILATLVVMQYRRNRLESQTNAE